MTSYQLQLSLLLLYCDRFISFVSTSMFHVAERRKRKEAERGSKYTTLHRVSKNVPPLACYNFDTHECILIFTDKVGNQKTLYYATSSNVCFCTTWQNGETRKSHFHSITRTIHLCAVFLKEKVIICNVFDNV